MSKQKKGVTRLWSGKNNCRWLRGKNNCRWSAVARLESGKNNCRSARANKADPFFIDMAIFTGVLVTMIIFKRLSVIVLLLLLTPSTLLAWTGKCVMVVDGDTLRIKDRCNQEIIVHLYGIDAPERGQCFGREAQEELLNTISEKWIDVQGIDTDGHGYVRAIVHQQGKAHSINMAMVAKGLAWVDDQNCHNPFCGEWQRMEQEARQQRIGLWYRESPIAPWQWRINN